MKMKRILKWTGIVVGALVVLAFFAFLYFIPPFTLVPPSEFIKPTLAAPPSLESVTDPAERMLAERGKYLARSLDCSGCHTPQGDQGPNWDEYLAGGTQMRFRHHGMIIARNLTPDPETGLARRSNEEVLRVFRSGVLAEGRQAYYRDMPWAFISNWTEEDRYALLVYLRHLKPVHHPIADPDTSLGIDDPTAVEAFYGEDLGGHTAKK